MGVIARAAVILAVAAFAGCGENDACMPTSLDRIICAGDNDCADGGSEGPYCDTEHEVVVDSCESTAHVCATRDAGE